ncbi:hypothetical protein DERF_001652 [Dermatophagoides farinae]|uniref:Uncharacterized protein n=1 Tax=Dermatophagoides farinae TaxID=6954 RepID=A0A922IAW2_DERFA|nr:hypothetical protein DERF_001652 [Dermatophagoides farinae]
MKNMQHIIPIKSIFMQIRLVRIIEVRENRIQTSPVAIVVYVSDNSKRLPCFFLLSLLISTIEQTHAKTQKLE